MNFSDHIEDGSIKFFRGRREIDSRIEIALLALVEIPKVSKLLLSTERNLLIPRTGFKPRGYDEGINAFGVRINAGSYSRKVHLKTAFENLEEVKAYVHELHRNKKKYFPRH